MSSAKLTLDREDAAAAHTASIVLSFARVNAIVLEPGGVQLQVRGGVHQHYLVVVSLSYLLVIFVPTHFKGM